MSIGAIVSGTVMMFVRGEDNRANVVDETERIYESGSHQKVRTARTSYLVESCFSLRWSRIRVRGPIFGYHMVSFISSGLRKSHRESS